MNKYYPTLINPSDVRAFQENIEQVPTTDNDHTAICSVNIGSSFGCFSSFGVATPEMIGGSTDTQKLLDKAKHIAVQQASYLFNQFIKSHQDIEDFEDTKDSECSNTTH